MVNIHENIIHKLNCFNENKKIPNIIFHGPSGSGKRSIVNNFINTIYKNNSDLKKSHVMYVDCGHGKGIKFIRDELKFFAKTNILNSSEIIKSIILLNADKLTIDAQSALRRCIELFSNTTRFFIIIEDKSKLLRPILSRFSEIFIGLPIINGVEVNLHKYNINNIIDTKNYDNKRAIYLKNKINKLSKTLNLNDILILVEQLYQKGYSGIDIIKHIELDKNINNLDKYTVLVLLCKVKREFRNEKIIMCWGIIFGYFRSEYNLENISFI
jgi:DNA polymerase III delta prime subunit|tara:strand:+ start:5809 stop:6618 length:810 start_codon:yes stop_codon:yes gene_type:complete